MRIIIRWLQNVTDGNQTFIFTFIQMYCYSSEKLPEEGKLNFGDRVRYHYEGSNYDGCEGVVLEQEYHRCYRDYETKVNIKLQQGGYTDVWMWSSNLEKLQGGKSDL